MMLNLVLIVGSILALWFGADWLVDSAARIARRLGISELVVGLTVVAFGTSAPEFAVSVQAALTGAQDISVGNVVGSNVVNVCFVLGLVAIVRAVHCSRPLVVRDGSVMIASSVVLALFAADGTLSRAEGGLLLAALVTYLALLILRRVPLEEESTCGDMRWYDPFRTLGGLAVVVVGGRVLVGAASALARAWGVSEWAIGVTIVAAGTSMPEVATSVVAVLRGRYGISAGNLVGSNIFNILGVLGLSAAMRPLAMPMSTQSSIALLIGLMVLVTVMMRTGWRVSRAEGLVLLGINAVTWLATFGVFTFQSGPRRQALLLNAAILAAVTVLVIVAVGSARLARRRGPAGLAPPAEAGGGGREP